MINRRLLSAALLGATLALPSFAIAKDGAKFTDAAFQAAQNAGKPILVEVSAPWCPTCKAQAPIINGLLAKPEYKDMVRLNVDFDSMKDTLKGFNVQKQSTLIVFKGKSELGRSTGDTSPNTIESLVRKAI